MPRADRYLEGFEKSPWHRGVIGNIVELYKQKVDWSTVFSLPGNAYKV